MPPQIVSIIFYTPLPPPPPPPPPPAREKGQDDIWSDPVYNPYNRKPHDASSPTSTDYNPPPSFTQFSDTLPSSTSLAPPASTRHDMHPSGSSWPGSPAYKSSGEHHPVSSAAMGAAGAIATIALLCLTGAVAFCLCRKSRRDRKARRDGTNQQEMIKTNQVPDTRAYIRPPSTTPPPSIATPSNASLPPIRREEPPQLLSTTIDQSYYTGIDTSDMVSVTDNQRHSTADGGYASSISEPPPPYRPCSIPPFSRDSSVRIPSGRPPSYGPRLSVRSQREVIRSPFEDPEGDSPISETNEDAPTTRDMEEMSDVSELSYQEEPVVARSALN